LRRVENIDRQAKEPPASCAWPPRPRTAQSGSLRPSISPHDRIQDVETLLVGVVISYWLDPAEANDAFGDAGNSLRKAFRIASKKQRRSDACFGERFCQRVVAHVATRLGE